MRRGAPGNERVSIGRYEIVGPLAFGGMAEVVLGRVRGPSGFERPVVIKRILPHLAREAEFRQMFLDEARIAARIRHPNVVSVEELGEAADDLYLVMEYLEGESLSTLGKLLAKRSEALSPRLAAHIVAEACAGLHAAHELKGPDGAPLSVVHRDVSPQNVFVLYEGHVKVIDFGIAKAKTSESKTRTGQVKGKFAYMAPEQLLAQPSIDRRADVFALGILLFELSTGTRLFERANDLMVLRAVCEDPLPLPTSQVPGYPKSLEEIYLRALSRNPEGRYATAAAMRRDLLAALKDIPSTEPAEEELSALMMQLFEDRIAKKRAMLASLERGEQVTELPPGEDSFRSSKEAETEAAAPEPPASVVAAEAPSATRTNVVAGGEEARERPARSRWPLMVVGLAVLVVAAVAVPMALRGPRQAADVEAGRASAPPPEAAATTAIPAITVSPSIPTTTPSGSPTEAVSSANASRPTASADASAGVAAADAQARSKPRVGAPPPPPKTAAPSAEPAKSSTGFRRFD